MIAIAVLENIRYMRRWCLSADKILVEKNVIVFHPRLVFPPIINLTSSSFPLLSLCRSLHYFTFSFSLTPAPFSESFLCPLSLSLPQFYKSFLCPLSLPPHFSSHFFVLSLPQFRVISLSSLSPSFFCPLLFPSVSLCLSLPPSLHLWFLNLFSSLSRSVLLSPSFRIHSKTFTDPCVMKRKQYTDLLSQSLCICGLWFILMGIRSLMELVHR